MRRRTPAMLAAAIPAALAASLLIAPAASAADTDIVINEVQSNSAEGAPDFFELTNIGSAPVDMSGWIARDSKDAPDAEFVELPAGTVIEPGEIVAFEPDTLAGMGLGKQDAVRIFTASGTLVAEHTWSEHVISEGRVPDGTGAFGPTEPTPGAANVARFAASPIVINEVESNGDARGDWVELANTDTVNTVDLSGWTLVDGDPEHEPIVLPEGATIESGGYRAIITDGTAYTTDFGLGGGDSVTLRDAAGAVVDQFSWESHADVTYARCADMTGGFVQAATSTFELVNDCSTVDEPVVEAEPWPFAQTVTDAVAAGTWGDDMSGLDYAADGTLFAVNNDNAEIFELTEGADGVFSIAQSWIPTYADGSGQPDAEGISVAGDGAIFLATERDNAAKSVSRPSILRVELGADGTSTTTHEWNLTSVLGELGANLGPEAIEWISDADATRLGVLDASGAAYDPDAYGEHSGGVFAFAVEQTGMVYVAVLEASGEITLLQEADPGAALEVVMGLDWAAGGNALWALCDEACDNRHAELAFVDGQLTAQRAVHAAPTMEAGYTNEGLAIDWCETDPAAVPTVAWISDTAHEGVSLRIAAGDECAAVAPVDPTEPGEPTVPAEPAEPTAPGEPTDPGAGQGDDGQGDDGQGAGSSGGQVGGDGTLPQTGADAPVMLMAGALLLLLAGAGLVLGRRRSA
ncbi:lamin tail domain-containing protein [Agrococcus sp. Marseille-P2731]|uniref:lamin tail domain-containing protein n=1 Tax=Agrococcus sp. Marseille-P2731 TaxID=1841862 RepID=UPI0009FA2E1F|nr:lamin tail domain-containing protein [Agrococcus sp. Marseille-P2731]